MESLFAQHSFPEAFPFLMIFMVVLALLVIVPIKLLITCMICHKAGYPWTLGLLVLVPIANIVLVFVLAFADWPVRRELRQLKQMR